jgi:hypothetical protein
MGCPFAQKLPLTARISLLLKRRQSSDIGSTLVREDSRPGRVRWQIWLIKCWTYAVASLLANTLAQDSEPLHAASFITYLQPLDVVCFSPLKRKYSQRVRDLARRRVYLPALKDAFTG